MASTSIQLEELPHELVVEIVRWLDVKALAALGGTSRWWRQLSRSDLVWRSLLQHHRRRARLPLWQQIEAALGVRPTIGALDDSVALEDSTSATSSNSTSMAASLTAYAGELEERASVVMVMIDRYRARYEALLPFGRVLASLLVGLQEQMPHGRTRGWRSVALSTAVTTTTTTTNSNNNTGTTCVDGGAYRILPTIQSAYRYTTTLAVPASVVLGLFWSLDQPTRAKWDPSVSACAVLCRLDNDTHFGVISYVYSAQSLCLRQRICVPGVGQYSYITYTEVPQLEEHIAALSGRLAQGADVLGDDDEPYIELAECGIQVLALSASSCQVVHVVSFATQQNEANLVWMLYHRAGFIANMQHIYEDNRVRCDELWPFQE